MPLKRILIPIFSLLLCVAVLWKWTDGFSAFTIYSYTLKEAGPTPRAFPDIPFIDQDGHVFHVGDKRRYLLMNFVYLDCPSVCHKVNNRLETIYHLFDTAVVPARLSFVTVSFDVDHDGIKKIKRYRSLFGSDIDGWRFALPYHTDDKTFRQTLQKVGIWTYRLPETAVINHATYLFLISPDGKIVQVFDPARERNGSIVKQIQQCLEVSRAASLSS